MNLENVYLNVIKERFNGIKRLGDDTIDQLTEDDIHWTLNEASNSIAVLAKHISGNMISRSTNFLTTDGEKPNRKRDSEFEEDSLTKHEMIAVWEKGWSILFETLEELEGEHLLRDVYIRGKRTIVLEALERQLTHYASHIGQIVYIGKQLKNNTWVNLSIPKRQSEEYFE
ncbi:DUF1572 family protein [Mammaliicoccus sciuri]|uniref:DUF1572 domain-containing protein n=1 Tax=Sporosarcina newyorkensis TaxID=759851 RepID=A0A1T4YA41_9BACL|nr:DUF1572 family protein [Sporosarcina newyorkensis]SKA98626.1 Protein of unknown function [Sporosarcina newyorkensis]